MSKYVLTIFYFVSMWHCTILSAEDPPSRLDVDLPAGLRRQPRDDDAWKDRQYWPYEAVVLNATKDPDLSSFATDLGSRFNRSLASNPNPRSGERVNYLTSLAIENTTLTPEQARQLEKVATERLTISNCEISDEVAEALGGLRCEYITLKKLKLSDRALSALMNSQVLQGFIAEEIRGCTVNGWRGLANRRIGVSITNCDFTDDAFMHLANSECAVITLRNVQVTGAGLQILNGHKDKLKTLILSGCPITDEALQKLPDLPNLTELNLSRTAITDMGLQKLPQMPELLKLDLSGTTITDEGFRNFIVPPDLYDIRLTGTKVTPAWGLEVTRQHQVRRNSAEVLIITFQNDLRWPPLGGYCTQGEFQLYK